MLFLVRNGNPKNIRDWADLIKPGVQVVLVNPKTGGNGRMAYLAAWGHMLEKGGATASARSRLRQPSFIKTFLFLPRADATRTGVFLQRRIGDVLITL
jgi:sulfate transport system substrate-binding protein